MIFWKTAKKYYSSSFEKTLCLQFLFSQTQTQNITGTLFFACHAASVKDDDVWFVDSACSNHMTSNESMLINVDRSIACKVKMGSGDLVPAMSVGQMMEHGYYILFGGNKAIIFDDARLENVIAKVIMKGNRCFPLSLESLLPVMFWAEAVGTAVYLQNRCYTKAVANKTPFECFTGRKPGIKHLRIFGCICYTHIPASLRQKFDDKAEKGIFMGYGSCEKGYRVYIIQSNRIVLSRSVVFDEGKAYDWQSEQKGQQKFIPSHLSWQDVEHDRSCGEEDVQTESVQFDNGDDSGNEGSTLSKKLSVFNSFSPKHKPKIF